MKWIKIVNPLWLSDWPLICVCLCVYIGRGKKNLMQSQSVSSNALIAIKCVGPKCNSYNFKSQTTLPPKNLKYWLIDWFFIYSFCKIDTWSVCNTANQNVWTKQADETASVSWGSLLSPRGGVLPVFLIHTKQGMFPCYILFFLLLSLSLWLTFGAPVRGRRWRASSQGHCFPVFGRSRRFVTAACASGLSATPLPSGRSEGWERLRDPTGGCGGGGGGGI